MSKKLLRLYFGLHSINKVIFLSSLAAASTTSAAIFEPSFIHLDDVDSPISQQNCQQSGREPSPEVDWSGGGRLPKATAMYEFLASRNDEINMVCNEKVVLLGTGDGEDWVKAGPPIFLDPHYESFRAKMSIFQQHKNCISTAFHGSFLSLNV